MKNVHDHIPKESPLWAPCCIPRVRASQYIKRSWETIRFSLICTGPGSILINSPVSSPALFRLFTNWYELRILNCLLGNFPIKLHLVCRGLLDDICFIFSLVECSKNTIHEYLAQLDTIIEIVGNRKWKLFWLE